MEEDPGWPFTPGFFRGRQSDLPGQDVGQQSTDLRGLRIIFSAFVTGVVLFGVLTTFIVATGRRPRSSQTVFSIVVVVICLALLVAAEKLRPSWDLSSEKALSGSYRGRVIVQSAFAEGAALLMIVSFNITTLWWMGMVAVVIGVIGFGRAAPTKQAIQREQEALQAQGSPLSLMAALTRPIPQAQTRNRSRKQNPPPPPPPPT